MAAILVLSVWGEFLIPLLLTSTMNAKPVTVQITEYVGKYTTNYPILAAGGGMVAPALVYVLGAEGVVGLAAPVRLPPAEAPGRDHRRYR